MSRSRAAVPAGLLAAFKFSQEAEEADQEHVVAAQLVCSPKTGRSGLDTEARPQP